MDDVAAAYRGIAGAWADGPTRVYAALARAIVDAYPSPLRGRTVLDLGAGTGVVSRLLLERRARAVALDSAVDMIAHDAAPRPPGVAGDMRALPFTAACFDGVIAAFSLSHVDDPVAALGEVGRVLKERGTVVVGVFAARHSNRPRDAVDAVAAEFGFVPPQWYARFKTDLEPLSNTPQALAACAERAGFDQITITEREVDTGVAAPQDIVAARIGTAHLAPFVASLEPVRRAAFLATAVAAAARNPQRLRPAVLVMAARLLSR